MANYSKEFLEKTIKVWQPYRSTPLTIEDAREIADNMVALYSYLLDLEESNKREVVII